jgi:tetratricopeptide (TPR) repeat protein/TolB-like protein
VNFADSLRRDLSTGVSAIARDVTLMALAADAAGSSPSGGARSLALSAGARYVVEGDVRSGDTDKIVNLRLVDTESGIQAWSGQYTFHETDGSVESSIAKRKVMGRLVGAVWVAESKRVLSLPIDRLTPAELVVRGWAMYGQSETLATAAEARRLFDAALAADPNNVMALKARAQVLNEFLNLDPNIGLEQLAREMDHYSNRAMNLDPWGPEVWELRAVSLRYQRRWNAAIEALDQAIKRDPFSPAYYTEKANNVIMLGAPEDALRLLDRALAMNPSNPWWEFMNQCYAHLLLGQPDRAIQACEKSIGYYDFWATHSFLVAAFANKGDMERAADAARALQKGAPGYTIARARRYSEVPEFVALAEKYWFTGMRKAGVPEK